MYYMYILFYMYILMSYRFFCGIFFFYSDSDKEKIKKMHFKALRLIANVICYTTLPGLK